MRKGSDGGGEQAATNVNETSNAIQIEGFMLSLPKTADQFNTATLQNP
jgi:hypothetical protein